MIEKKPKVSVCVVTYNQRSYIRQCLQSIIDQETDFHFEVIVGDDCSTDGTRLIVQEFAQLYPAVMKPIYHKKNIGMTKNLLAVHRAAKGEYIAHMDGDDFMLPSKLKIQVSELDKNPDCVMCFHPMKQFDQYNQRYRKSSKLAIPKKSDLAFLLMHPSWFAHSSKMYRAECRNGIDSATEEMLDFYFHVHHALQGKILYLNDLLGVYRLNVGVYYVKNNNKGVHKIPAPWVLSLSHNAIEYAGRSGVEEDLINKAKANSYFEISYRHLIAKDFKKFQMLINKSYETSQLNSTQFFFKAFSGIPIILYLMVRLRESLKRFDYFDR